MAMKLGNVPDKRNRRWRSKPSVVQPRKKCLNDLTVDGRRIPPPPIHMLSPITFLYTRRLRIKGEGAPSHLPTVAETLNFAGAAREDGLPEMEEPGKRRARPVTLIDIIKSKRLDQWFGLDREPAAS